MMTMKNIDDWEYIASAFNGDDATVPISIGIIREFVARAKAWERVLKVDEETETCDGFGSEVCEIVDAFKAAAAKGFRP